MNTQSTCPDLAFLSQFLDQELEGRADKEIKQHLIGCSECRTKLEHLKRAKGRTRVALARSSSPSSRHAPSPECLSPELVSAYVQRLLSAQEGVTVEKHLHACDVCLNEVRDAVRIASSLTAAKRVPVPATLKTRVAVLWESAPAAEKGVSFSRLVIEIAQKGLQLLEQHLVPPLLNVQEILAPLPAYRAEEGPAALNLRINSGQAQITASAIREGNGLSLTLSFLGAKQEALAGQRVFLRQHGRSIFSARTDTAGVLQTPHLEPGLYEVECSGIHATFQLELRA